MEFKDYKFSCDELLDVIKLCIVTDCGDRCKSCPLEDEGECRDTLLYNLMLMIQRLRITAETSQREKDELIHRCRNQNDIITALEKKNAELEQELEERCNNCDLIPDQDPQNYDLMQIVDELANACTDLVQHKRIKPITLLCYIEDIIRDRERRRVWNPDTEEME